MTEPLLRPKLPSCVEPGQEGPRALAYLIQYFQGGSLIGSSTAVGSLSLVSKDAECGMRRRDADAVKVFAGAPIEAVWSKKRAAR